MFYFDIYAELLPFWQKRREDRSPEVKRAHEVAAYYERLVKPIKESWKNEPPLP